MAPVDASASASASPPNGTEVPGGRGINRGAFCRLIVRFGPPARPRRQGPEDPSIRRTWWLLSGAFLILGAITVLRLLTARDLVDVVPVVVVVIAAVAAIGHRNAVAGLEALGRGEAESFARILRGLSRSLSADAVVAAIMDDLVDATGADHVVVVRRRQDGSALEATLVTRRAGVPATTSVLPIADLDGPVEVRAISRVPVGRRAEAGGGDRRAGDGAAPELGVASAMPGDHEPGLALGTPPGIMSSREPGLRPTLVGAAASLAIESRPLVRRAPAPGRDAIPGPFADAGVFAEPSRPGRGHAAPSAVPGHGQSRVATRWATSRRLAGRALSETGALLRDLGVPAPGRVGRRSVAPVAETLGSGHDAAVAERVAERVRSLFGLAQTLAAPLRTDQGLIGAIVLSRRDREPWSDAERRLLRGGAAETANALARADSHREAEALAATDPLTGLPNRRYFDEFCSLLARRRRAGDAVAVLMIDIDKFKVLNDTYGHPVGDEVLKAVAGAIVASVREHDVPARVGGEEFAVLLRNPGPEVALEVGERVRESVHALDLSAVRVPWVSVSVGVANALGPEEPMPDLVGRADHALLRAKRTGRDRVVAA
jgi:diguanylate cyclase (GGDEF)-like protein